MNNQQPANRLNQIIQAIKDRINYHDFTVRTLSRYGWERAKIKVEKSNQAIKILQIRKHKLESFGGNAWRQLSTPLKVGGVSNSLRLVENN